MPQGILRSLGVTAMVLAAVLVARTAGAQNVQVTAANPASGEQGTVSLVVKISGKNFAPGARADFFLSGTTDPAGVTVRGTQWVSATEVDATIDIADTAALASFDIRVANTNGRSGKGSDLFNVIRKTVACVIPTTDPAHFQLLQTLNGVVSGGPQYSGAIGLSLRVAEATVPLPSGDSRNLLIVFTGTSGPGKVEIFFMDPGTGTLLDGTALGLGAGIQSHLTVSLPYSSPRFAPFIQDIAAGDLNGDGVPDAIAADGSNMLVVGLLSHLDPSGVISYTTTTFPPPSTAAITFGQAVAIGDTDGQPGNEVLVVQKDQSTKTSSSPARLFVYRLVGQSFVLTSTITPSLVAGDNFGNTIAVGDVTGDERPDVIGGAPGRDVGRAARAGAVLVFQGTGATPPYQPSTTPIVLTLTTPLKDDRIGNRVFIGNSTSAVPDTMSVLALSGDQLVTSPTAPPIRGVVFRGPVGTATKEMTADTFAATGAAQGNGWGGGFNDGTLVADLDQDGIEDVVVGTFSADATPECPMTGAVYYFAGQRDSSGRFAGWQRHLIFQPSDDPSPGDFGMSLAAASAWHLLFVGDTQRAVGGEASAGQIYVYSVF